MWETSSIWFMSLAGALYELRYLYDLRTLYDKARNLYELQDL